MRVILGSDAIHRPLTGIGRYAYELARQLRGHPGIDALDFFTFGHWQQWEDLAPLGVLDGAGGNSPSGTQSSVAPLKSLRSVLAGNAAVVKAYQAITPAYYRWRLRHARRALFHSPNYFLPPHPGPCVATIHDLSHLFYPQFHPQVRVNFMKRALPDTLKRADFLITDAESVRHEVIEHFGWQADRIAAIHLGVDAAYRPRAVAELAPALARYGLRAGGYTLFVGTVEPRKNLQGLISAYAQLPPALRQRWPLVVAGAPGWQSDAIHQQMERASREGWLHYVRYVQQVDLPLLYSGAQVFAYPSLYEGFGLPPLEAMASGVPVVTSSVSSMPEVVQTAALTVHPQDVDQLGQALAQALQDEVWRAQAVAKGLQRAAQLTWNRCADATVRIYAQVMATS